MRKVFSILLALGLVLTMGVMSAVPAAAVSPGSVYVDVLEPLAGDTTSYYICFHNGSFLEGGLDYIDIMFPAGTDASGAVLVSMEKVAYCGAATGVAVVGAAIAPFGTRTIRVTFDDDIYKCEYVAIVLSGIVNPLSCFHHLQVGSSTHTPSVSNEYAIYTAKMCLAKGMNLISLPAYPADTSIEVVLADLFAWAALTAGTPIEFVFSVWYWDSWAQEWVIYASDTSFDDLTTMEAGKAYWIKVNYAPPCFYFKGTPYPEGQGPPQKWCYPECWSMIGITGITDLYASVFLSDAMLPWPHQNTYAVSTIFSFNATTQAWYDTFWDPGQRNDATWQQVPQDGFPDDAMLEAERGYFMSFLGEACIIPPLP